LVQEQHDRPVPIEDDLEDALMWGLPSAEIRAALEAADGQELRSGKLFSPQSSSALALNAFGPFVMRPASLPPLPGTEALDWPALSVRIEAKLRFPWRGGRGPNLDVLVETQGAIIGIESKRFEPFDVHGPPPWSETYWRQDWGEGMRAYAALRDRSRDGATGFRHVDEAQLIKHAFGLWTATRPPGPAAGKQAWLLHLHAEPKTDRRGRDIGASTHARLKAELDHFADAVASSDVRFLSLTYSELLTAWRDSPRRHVRAHAAAVRAFFDDDV
jgi:hypothetical protein